MPENVPAASPRTGPPVSTTADVLAHAIQAAGAGVCVVDSSGAITAVNPAFEALLGLDASRLIGLPFSTISIQPLPESDAWLEIDRRERCYSFTGAGGKDVFAAVSTVPVRAGDGTSGWLLVAHEATDFHDHRALLREREEQLLGMFENLQELYFEVDLFGNVKVASPSALRHTGYTPDELVGMNVHRLIPDDSLTAGLAGALSAGRDRLTNQDATLRRKDETTVPVSINVALATSQDGQPIGYRGTLVDLSETRGAERDRDRIFSLSLDMLAVLDTRARMIRANPAWVQTTGYALPQLIGSRPFDRFHPLDELAAREARERLRAGALVRELRIRFRCADGAYKWFSWSITPPADEGEVYCVVRDISNVVEAETQREALISTLKETAERLARQAAELQGLRDEAEYAATHDALTGLLNRRAWFDLATRTRPAAVTLLDLDSFKQVNDTFGHPGGDVVLIEVGKRMMGRVASRAHVGRIGGEEFGILFKNYAEAVELSHEVLDCIGATPIALSAAEITVTASAGLAPGRRGGRSREDAVARTYEDADQALYEAKRSGRARLVLSRDLRAGARPSAA